MLENLPLQAAHVSRIYELIELKKQKSEAYLHPDEPELVAMMESIVREADKAANALPPAKGNMEDLNAFFRKTLLG